MPSQTVYRTGSGSDCASDDDDEGIPYAHQIPEPPEPSEKPFEKLTSRNVPDSCAQVPILHNSRCSYCNHA